MRRRGGCLARLLGGLLGALLLGGAAVYAVAALTAPWAFHIGGRWTPLLTWRGSGLLHTKGGRSYPIYVEFHPSSSFSRLRVDGLRPMGGVKGSAWICTSRGVVQRLALGGTVYGGWRSTEESLFSFRLGDRSVFPVGRRHGYFDLYGRFQGLEMVMDQRGTYAAPFDSGMRIENSSARFRWASYFQFQDACASASPSAFSGAQAQ